MTTELPMQLRPPLPGPLTSLLQAQSGAVAAGQVVDLYSEERLAGLTAAGRLTRLWRGAYCLPHLAADPMTRLHAADLTCRRPVVAYGQTAAQLFDLPVRSDGRLHLWSADDHGSHCDSIVIHRDNLHLPLRQVAARPTVSRAETAVALAAALPGPHALAVLDAALRQGVRRSLLEALAADASRRGIRQARRYLAWADRRAESPGESWLRWLILDAGLPPPGLQYEIVTAGGRLRRLDLAWPERRVACEYDGVAFHTGALLSADRDRMNELVAESWTVVSATSHSVFVTPGRLLGRLTDLLT